MMPNLAIAVLAVAWFVIVVRKRAGRRLHGLVVGALPLALLFITWPLTVAVWQMTRGMAVANEARDGPAIIVVPLLMDVSSSLGLGSVGALVIVSCGLALQLWHSEAPDDSTDMANAQGAWPTLVLYAGVLLVVPVAVDAWLGHLIIDTFRQAINPDYLIRASRASVAESSVRIAQLTVLVLTAGVLLSGLLTILSLANLAALVRVGRVKWAAFWTWTIVAIVLALAGWNVLRARSGMEAFHTATAIDIGSPHTAR